MKPKVEVGKPSKRVKREKLKAKIQALVAITIFIAILACGLIYSIRFIITNWN